VTVELSGVQARGGTVLASLQTRDQFMKPVGSYGATASSPSAGVLRLTIPNVAPGEYALSVLHDVDGDMVMDVSPAFIPTEGWAMVNGETLRGPPTFDQVKVTVPPAGSALQARIIYMDGKIPTQ
jgi:uncharacterized protein (DUF2141 family)